MRSIELEVTVIDSSVAYQNPVPVALMASFASPVRLWPSVTPTRADPLSENPPAPTSAAARKRTWARECALQVLYLSDQRADQSAARDTPATPAVDETEREVAWASALGREDAGRRAGQFNVLSTRFGLHPQKQVVASCATSCALAGLASDDLCDHTDHQ